MSNIDTTIPVSEVNVDGVTMTLIGSENKVAQIVSKIATEITAKDLAGATIISDYAFYYYSGLTSIEIPEGVTSIGRSAFQACTGLTGELVLPNSMITIGQAAFNGCMGFTGTLIIPNNVTEIANGAFNGCRGFTSVEIWSGVASIGNSAFAGCRFDTMTIKATIPPELINANAIPSSYVTTIYIPSGALNLYQTATNWSAFADKFVEKDM